MDLPHGSMEVIMKNGCQKDQRYICKGGYPGHTCHGHPLMGISHLEVGVRIWMDEDQLYLEHMLYPDGIELMQM